MEHAFDGTLALPVWMRDPQWRWKLALRLRADPSQSIIPLRRDRSLFEAAEFYRSLCRAPDAHLLRRRRFPDMIVAYAIWSGASLADLEGVYGTGRWRGIVESLILTGLAPADFSEALGVAISPRAVQLYHDVFFDVGSYLESEPAVYVNVLSSAEQELVPGGKLGTMERNCLLRLFAYTWGADALLSYFFSRSRGQNLAHGRWLRQLAGDILTRDVVCEAIAQRGAYTDECIATWKLAQANWQLPAESLNSVEDEIRKRFLHETVQALGDQLRRADEIRANRDTTRAEALREAAASGFIHL